MHLAIWIVTALVMALWLLLGHGVATLFGLAAGLQGLPAEWYDLLGRVPGAVWMDLWAPGWREAVVQTADVLAALLGWMGAALPVLVWVIFGLGAVGLVGFAVLLSALVAVSRRKTTTAAA